MNEGANDDKHRGISYSRFACIGTGFSGVCLGATLKRWYNITDVRLFERHGDLGGTWLVNNYPGCRVDIPNALYSLSFEKITRGSKFMHSHDETWEYVNNVAKKYDLRSKMTFNANVERCVWMPETQRWRITVHLKDEDRRICHESQFLFGAGGLLSERREVDIPGADTFTGPLHSTIDWPHELDTAGKRVIVVGNGCTGTQMVGALADNVEHVTHFARSKHFIIPRRTLREDNEHPWIYNNVPGMLLALRLYIHRYCDDLFKAFKMTEDGARRRKELEEMSNNYIRKKTPEKYHGMLIPEFSFGCKRRIYDWNYVESLNKDNVTLTTDRILEIIPEGVRTENGVVEADIIALATGYSSNRLLPGVDVVGRDGVTLKEHWDSVGGVEAYNTSSMNGFPNFFFILGPNTATGHTSTLLAIENNTNFALRLIKPILEGYASTVEVNRDAEERYADAMQKGLNETVYNRGGCVSWYADTKDGKPVWNSTTYPWSQNYFWYTCLFPKWRDFTYSPSPRAWIWSTIRFFFSQTMKVLVWTSLFISLMGVSQAARTHRLDLTRYGPFLKGWLQVQRARLLKR